MENNHHISKTSLMCLHIDQFQLFKKGNFIFTNGFSLLPVDKGTPVVTQEFCFDRGSEQKFEAIGTIRIPYRNSPVKVPFTVTCIIKIINKNYITFTYMYGHTRLNNWELAKGLVVLDGEVNLLCLDELPQVCLKGDIRYVDSENISITGTMDSSINYDPSNPDKISFTTRLTNTSLSFLNNVPMINGSIHLAYDSQSSNGKKYLKKCSKDDEATRFTCAGKIGLPPMCIEGIEDEPVTVAVVLNISSYKVNVYCSISGAQLRSEILGDDTTLFLHHKSYDVPFIINLLGKWTAYVSSNVFLHLLNPHDPKGPPLVTGTAFLAGRLYAHGLTAHKLVLNAELCGGEAFRESLWPQQLPDQDISLTITPESSEFNLKMNPVCLGNVKIYAAHDSKKVFQVSLCARGLSFPGGLYLEVTTLTKKPIALQPFIIDGNCCFIVDSFDHTIEIMDWFTLNAVKIQIRCEKDNAFIEWRKGTISISHCTITFEGESALFFNLSSNDFSQMFLRCNYGYISLPIAWGNLPPIPFNNVTTSLADFTIIASCSLPDTEFYPHPNVHWLEFRFVKPRIEVIVKKKEISAVFISENMVFQSKQLDTSEIPLIEKTEHRIKTPIIKNGILLLKLPDMLIEKTFEKSFQIRLHDLFGC